MKKNYPYFILFILLFVVQNTAKAQEFAPNHAEWWHNGYYYYSTTGGFSLNHTWLKGDTVIQGQTAKIIAQERFQKIVNPDLHITTIDTQQKRNLFIYERMDTIFIYNENFSRFTPLFVFNVAEGDTICLPVVPDLYGTSDLRPNPIAEGDTCFCFVVDSIRTVLYDTSYLETIFQHSLSGDLIPGIDNEYSWPVYNWSHRYVGNSDAEGTYAWLIGGLYNGFLPEKIIPAVVKPLQDTLTYQPFNELRCYLDDSLFIHIPQVGQGKDDDCYYQASTSIASLSFEKRSISIYPNPTTGKVSLKTNVPFEKNTILTLSDISGRTLQDVQIPDGITEWVIQVKDIKPGMYFLTLSSQNQKQVQKIIVSPH